MSSFAVLSDSFESQFFILIRYRVCQPQRHSGNPSILVLKREGRWGPNH